MITYRPKFAVRDMAKALGYSPGPAGCLVEADRALGRRWSPSDDHDIPQPVLDLADELLKARGTWASTPAAWCSPTGRSARCARSSTRGWTSRTVLQWDKDDCAWMGLVKFDLLGLGMLAALQYCFDLVREHIGEAWTLDTIPKEEQGVYDMLCRADSIGVFQVESRAQMGMLPRLQPRRFYDLVIEIALIRPGPDPGRRGASVRAAQAGQGAGHLPASAARAGAGAHPGRAAVPGAADADGDGGRRLQRARTPTCCAGRWAPSAGSSGSRRCKTKLYAGMADNGIVGERGRRDLREDRGVRELRLRREPLAAASPCWSTPAPGSSCTTRRVPRRAAARPADGLLLAADAGGGCPPARRRGAPAGHPALRRGRRSGACSEMHGWPPGAGHLALTGFGRASASPSSSRRCRRSTAASPTTRPSTAATGRSRCGSAWTRSPASAPRWRSASSPSGRHPGTSATCPTWCAARC